MILITICVWGLIICAACATQEGGSLTHVRPVEGMEGYTVLTREAKEPEKWIYGTDELKTQKTIVDKAQPAVEPQEAPAILTFAAEESTPQNLRRQRIPLRRNRYLLLKQQTLSPNISQE